MRKMQFDEEKYSYKFGHNIYINYNQLATYFELEYATKDILWNIYVMYIASISG